MTEEEIRQKYREYFLKWRNPEKEYPECLSRCSLPTRLTDCHEDAKKLFADTFVYTKERVKLMSRKQAHTLKCRLTWNIFHLLAQYNDCSTLDKCLDEVMRFVRGDIRLANNGD